ncbi:MAG: RidA family protein [Bacteroidetes bacterium]|nr:RidA family protein [Bacteroidota bacterium]
MKQLISSGTPWEEVVGYSRAVRIGDRIEVSGTTAFDGDKLIGEGDAYQQTHFIIRKIERALQEAGASLADVVRTRMYVTTRNVVEDVLRAHGDFFTSIRPAATMVIVSGLIDERLLVEIEVSAIVGVHGDR